MTIVEPLLERARRAQGPWSERSPRERGQVLLRFRTRLADRLDAMVEAITQSTGKPAFDATGEVFQLCDLIGYVSRRGPRLLAPRRVWAHLWMHKRCTVHYRPLGVVGVIAPSNYPLVLSLGPVIQALLAGNSVLLKPSERAFAPACLATQWLAEVLPEGVLQILMGGPEAGRALAAAAIDKLVFIGGSEGGRAVARIAAERLTPVVLELGGHDAMIVARDASLDRAAHAAVWGANFNAGQSCVSVGRCFVEASVHDAFVERVVSLARDLRLGDAREGAADFDLGPLMSPAQVDRLEALVQDAVDHGAILRLGGRRVPGMPLQFQPTVLTHVTDGMRVAREETFGPILPIAIVEDVAEAIRRANAIPQGLSASLWTASWRNAGLWASQLDVGGVVVNDCMVHFAVAELPFGGTKESGYGRLHGPEGLREFCATQSLISGWFHPKKEWHWFPTTGKTAVLKRLIRWMYGSWR